jgi:hypothetical protein
MNGHVTITSTYHSAEHLRQRITWILDLLDKEHHNCSTHSQRNAYQAVIRHELEVISDMLQSVRTGNQNDVRDIIPF